MDSVKKQKERKLKMVSSYQRLAERLKLHPELAKKLDAALETDRFFVTVTFQKRYKPTDKNDLHHYYYRRQFMTTDVMPTFKYLVNDFKAKEMPGAQIQSDDWI